MTYRVAVATSVQAHSIFLASPGGLESQRRAVRAEVDVFNAENMVEFGHAFKIESWEATPGGAGRAQSLLNSRLENCDLLILLLADRWGTPPDETGTYSSGTEEEFHIAINLLADPNKPMRDILILFKGLPPDRLSDPGPQLQKVLDFKQQREQARDVFYKVFDNEVELRSEIRRALQGWTRETPKPPAIGQPVPPQRVESTPPGGNDPLAMAKAFEEQGLITQAEHLYAQAMSQKIGGATAAYARFLRRTGRLARSIEVNEALLCELSANPTEANAKERSLALCNIGIALRKMGAHADSRQKIQEAAATLRTAPKELPDVLAYVLDNLAISMMRMNDLSNAESVLLEGLEIRRGEQFGPKERAESKLNVARLKRRQAEPQMALDYAQSVLEELSDIPNGRLHAAANSLIGEIFIADGRAQESIAYLDAALQVNESLGATDYTAMNAHELGLAYLEIGNTMEAEKYADRSLSENRKAANREGEFSALVLLGRVMLAQSRAVEALKHLKDARDRYADKSNPRAFGWALYYLGQAQADLGMTEESRASLELAATHGATG